MKSKFHWMAEKMAGERAGRADKAKGLEPRCGRDLSKSFRDGYQKGYFG